MLINNKSTQQIIEFIADFAQSKVALCSLFVFLTLLIVTLFAPLFSSQNPYDLSQIHLVDSQLSPGEVMSTGSVALLGTDVQGRDMWSAILYGLRLSLMAGLLSAVLALIIGTTLGLLAAHFGGKLDAVFMRFVDIQLSFPALLIGLVLVSLLGSGFSNIIIALTAVQWAYYARTVRSVALAELRKEYVEAARCLNISDYRILFRHVLPNCMAPLVVIVTVQIANSIAIESSLSFLGVGMPITEPSLGRLIVNGFDFMLSGHYWMSLYPGVALLVALMSINLIGDRLRTVLNPRNT